MRIRSIKPEFWRSDDITALSREQRLLFIGLWSYVDDNGVGLDDFRSIAADLFALEDDQKEIRDYVRETLATLSRVLLIDRYEVSGKRYIYINKWDRHQRVDRPNKVRYPRPPDDWKPPTSEDASSPRQIETPSRDPRETFATVSPPGTGEQGNRGTGEQKQTPQTADAVVALAPLAPGTQLAVIHGGTDEAARVATAQDATAAWCDAFTAHHDAKPTRQQRGQAAKESRALIEAGNPPDRVVTAARSAGARGFATVQREYRDLAGRGKPRPVQAARPATSDIRSGAALALADHYDRQEPSR